MKRRDLIGLLGTLPFLLAFSSAPYYDPAPVNEIPIQDILINTLKQEIKYNLYFNWMCIDDPNPYIGTHSRRQTAIIIRNNVVTIRTTGTMYDQVQAVVQRDELVDLVRYLLLDVEMINPVDNRIITLKKISVASPKTIVRYGQYIHYQQLIIEYE